MLSPSLVQEGPREIAAVDRVEERPDAARLYAQPA
jgi:hypothetical protein